MSFWSGKTVLVTGSTGFFGSHVTAALKAAGVGSLAAVGSRDYNLVQEEHVVKMFRDVSPDIVFHLAGLVGGVKVNKERPAEFYYQNAMMGTLVLHHAWRAGVKKFVCAGSGCMYPQTASMPMQEEHLWEGRPYEGNAGYAIAKRAVTEQALAYNQQYGLTSVTGIPGNMYGEHDNYNLNDSHVAAALVRKFAEAVGKKASSVEVWGTGKPTRDYIYAGDAARGMLLAAEKYNSGSHVVNLSSGVETSIKQLVDCLVKVSGFAGQVEWNSSKPDGQLRRCFDVKKAKQDFGFTASTSLESGLQRTFDWYVRNQDSANVRK